MRKAKLMLSAIAIVAVIGGAFAFKAKSSQGLYFGPEPGVLPTTYSLFFKTTAPTTGTVAYVTTTATLPVIATRVTAGS